MPRKLKPLTCSICAKGYLSYISTSVRCPHCQRDWERHRDVDYQTQKKKKQRAADAQWLAMQGPPTLNARQLQQMRAVPFARAVNRILRREVIYVGF